MAFVLDPPTHPVDAPVGDPHHMERVGHRDGMVEMGESSGGLRPGRWRDDDPDAQGQQYQLQVGQVGSRCLPPGR